MLQTFANPSLILWSVRRFVYRIELLHQASLECRDSVKLARFSQQSTKKAALRLILRQHVTRQVASSCTATPRSSRQFHARSEPVNFLSVTTQRYSFQLQRPVSESSASRRRRHYLLRFSFFDPNKSPSDLNQRLQITSCIPPRNFR